jgi:hypothetical protein
MQARKRGERRFGRHGVHQGRDPREVATGSSPRMRAAAQGHPGASLGLEHLWVVQHVSERDQQQAQLLCEPQPPTQFQMLN